MNISYREKTSTVDYVVSNYFDVPRFLECCKKCPEYNNNHSCPEYDFDTISYLKKFNNIKLILAKVDLVGFERNIMVYNDVLDEAKLEIRHYLEKVEKQKLRSQFLNPGPCKLCERCARKDGKPCRHKDLMRYSINSLGGNVEAILKDFFDIQILWVKDDVVPPYFTFLGGLLYK